MTKLSKSRVRSVADFLALKRSTLGILAMVCLILLGERMAERFLPIYLMALGGGAITIGLLNGLDNFLSAVYSFLGGYLSDRFGTKRALMFFNFAAMFGFGIVILIPAWQAVIVGAVFFLSWSAISLPATMKLITEVLPLEKRTMGVSMLALVRRIPMALGPLLGGVCISLWGERDGVRAAFVVALLLAIVATVIQQRFIEDNPSDSEKNRDRLAAEKNPFKLMHHMGSDLKRLLVSDILIRYCEQIPYAFVVIWCMKTITEPVSAVQFGFLTSIEMFTALLVYIPVAYLADKGGKKIFVLITFIFFTLFPLALLFSQSFAVLVPAFILRGFKEFGEPTRKALIMDLAPEERKAAVFGLYYMLRDMVVAVAAFGGAFLWMISPAANFLTAFVFGLIGTIGYAVWGRDVLPDQK
ncbi:MAG TPA: MFS transporter [Desulfocapsa sulfexigens]|nr:MFS transporter [Desulfocapsa sulfexigens]